MTHEQFNTYMEQCFDAFCKTVIRNESSAADVDLARELLSYGYDARVWSRTVGTLAIKTNAEKQLWQGCRP